MVTEGVWKWLFQLNGIPENWSVSQLLDAVSRSLPGKYILHFLFKYGLFYWMIRQQIRLSNENAITFAWLQAWPLFHATNKHQYAKMCLIATYIRHFTHPSIQSVLSSRLCSLKGIPGHDIGPNMLTEKVSNSRESIFARKMKVCEFIIPK